MSKDEEWKVTDAQSLITEALTLDYFRPNDEGVIPIPAHFVPGANGPLIVIVGENASGKSFMRRIVKAISQDIKVECMDISMEGRGGNYGGLRGMIYGDESWESTGVCSAGTVEMGLKTCRARDTRHIMFWDEPDLGLSENGAAGIGMGIDEYAGEPNPHTMAVIVVTHSKPLVQQFAHRNPHYLHLGTPAEEAPKTLQDWLNQPVRPRSIKDIREGGFRRFKLIGEVLKKVRA